MPVTSVLSRGSCSVWHPELTLLPSRLLIGWRLALMLLAAATLVVSQPPPVIFILLLVLWPVLAFWQLGAGQTTGGIRKFQQTPQGWRLSLHHGHVHFAELAGPVRINRWCIVLCWRELAALTDQEADVQRRKLLRWNVVIWADQLGADDWRRFSVALRWRRREVSDGTRMLSARVLLNSG